MAMPTLVTVTGTLLSADGLPEKGRVVFTSSVPSLSSADDTVMLPSSIVAVLNAQGEFSAEVPASNDPDWTPEGWTWNVSVQVSGFRYSFRAVIPYDVDPIEFSELTPAMGGGSELYAAYNHTHGGGGGSTAWNDITGKPVTFPPSAHTHDDRYFTEAEVTTLLSGKASTSHNHAISDVTGLQTALDGRATDGELAALDTRVEALEDAPGGGGSSVTLARAIRVAGDIPAVATGSFAVLSGLSLTIPAVAGDEIELTLSGMWNDTGTADYYDPCVVVSGSAVRYASTGTGTPATEGDPSLYPSSNVVFAGKTTSFSFTAVSGDISGGNITFGISQKGGGNATAKIYANATYPFRWTAKNFGQ